MIEPPSGSEHSYQFVNRLAWSRLAQQGNQASQPFDAQMLAGAREWLDPQSWIRWPEVRQVLCLASGGGQQAPMFAGLGCQVVSADICPEQLQRDTDLARKYSLGIECIEVDMLDLSALHGRNFDLVYQAISACYVPDVRRLYAEVARVLRPGGYYRVEHWNPVNMQLSEDCFWTGRGYEMVRPPQSSYRWQSSADEGGDRMEAWHYIHSLSGVIGGLCDAGFCILRFQEHGHHDKHADAGSQAHAYQYAPPFLSLYGQKM